MFLRLPYCFGSCNWGGGGGGGGGLNYFTESKAPALLMQWFKTCGPGCSKLTTSLVNVSLKFQTLISEIRHYFLLKNVRSFCIAKVSLTFSTKMSIW